MGVDVPQAPLGGWSLEATKGAARGCPDADRGFNHRLPQAIPRQICDVGHFGAVVFAVVLGESRPVDAVFGPKLFLNDSRLFS
ncbi:hypothetical protein NG2371_04985 [Nocardia gamkensis]|nr:hypothetical protein [Nocardia gamkensis]